MNFNSKNQIEEHIQLNRMAVLHLLEDYQTRIADSVKNDSYIIIYFEDNKARNDFVNEILHMGISCEIGLGELSLKIIY